MLTVIRGANSEPSALAQGTFTGEAWRDMVLAPTDGIAVGNNFFAPCSRTYWHSHVGGQLLIVMSGEGHVSDENGIVTVRAGDMVWTPPGVRHWHGAAEDRFMMHTSITLGATNWEIEVTDAEYGEARA